MLKIQEFILAHDNWRELLANAPYNLKITEDENFVMFKYNQISSDFNEKICREARGIILEKETWRVVRMAFEKFFNIDEPFADKIDWSTAVATEKIDGSIMSLWNDGEKWRLSTNGTIDAENAELADNIIYKNFAQLFDSVAHWKINYKNLNPNYCYTFELVSPYNKVVISYPEPELYLLSVRDMTTLEEKIGYCGEIPESIKRPQRYDLNSEKEFRQLVADMPEGHEGIVVRDAAGHRVKIKTLLYFQLHRTANNGKMTLERIVDLIKANDTDEFLAYFPEYNEVFADVRKRIEVCWDNVPIIQIQATGLRNMLESQFSQKVARKEFAHIVEDKVAKPLWFIAYDGDLKKRVESYTTPQFIRAFSHIFKGYLD
jgi:T4 RnlA family RNA ligase